MRYAIIGIVIVLVGAAAFALMPRGNQMPTGGSVATDTSTSTVVTSTPSTTSTSGGAATQNDLVLNLERNPLVKSPLTFSGKLRGSYMFEASFPINVTDENGKVLGSAAGRAQSDWMTTELVPFTATIRFSSSTTPTGYLIIKKDNPSGLPENEKSIKIPVRFTAAQGTGAGILPYNSGVKGRVMLGPSCPVQSASPTDACADQPFKTVISVFRLPATGVIAEVSTDVSGYYSISLPPGDYTVTAKGGALLPRCSSGEAKVLPGVYATVDISCDTGIR